MTAQTPRKWTDEEKSHLMSTYGIRSTLDIALKLNRTEYAIRTQASMLGLTEPAYMLENNDETADAIRRNQAFVEAMTKAIRAGLEHPPMVGVDTRPGTTRPLMIEVGETFVAQSTIWADM